MEKVLAASEAAAVIIKRIGKADREHLLVLSLDTRQNLIGVDTASIGTLDANLVHPRELFILAIRRHAASVIVAHNHPSGEVEPSENDVEVTKRLVTAGKILGIDLYDHIIVGRKEYLSMREKDLL